MEGAKLANAFIKLGIAIPLVEIYQVNTVRELKPFVEASSYFEKSTFRYNNSNTGRLASRTPSCCPRQVTTELLRNYHCTTL